jgi:hypothetical protein
VIGSTAGSLSRIIQDRETELWEGKRIVGEASSEELQEGQLTVPHPSFRTIVTASKSLPLKEWVSDEHANMFFTLPSHPMDPEEEATVLRAAGCPDATINILLSFADKYRRSLSGDNIIKNRRLGTRTLVSIARRIAVAPQEDHDLYTLISRSLLAEFLPAVEKLNLNTLLEDSNIFKRTDPVSSFVIPMRFIVLILFHRSTTLTRLSRTAHWSSLHLHWDPLSSKLPRFLCSMFPRTQMGQRLMSPTWSISMITAFRLG